VGLSFFAVRLDFAADEFVALGSCQCRLRIEQRKWRNDRALFEYRNRLSEQIDLIKTEELPTLGSDAT
jgi:hypothetical protein